MSDVITRKRGDDYSIFLELSDGANVPILLTGTSAVMSVSSKREPTTAAYTFQITGSIYGADVGGVYEFSFDASAADNVGKFYYDVELTDSGGKIRTVGDGIIIFKQDIGK